MIVSVSITDAGRRLAQRLPHEHAHGQLVETLRSRWDDVDAFVVFAAVGAVVRAIAPLLRDKHRDPAVVCVDDGGSFAVVVAGGHARGANSLARAVADRLGATAVVTTATDAHGISALDQLAGFVASGDVAGVTRARLDGEVVAVVTELPGWPVPIEVGPVEPGPGEPAARVVITDRTIEARPGLVALHPPSLVAGIGASSGAPAGEVAALLGEALDGGGLARDSLAEIATIDRKRAEPALRALGLPIRAYAAAHLANVRVPHPSPVVERAVGTASVAEAAARLAAGPGGEIVVTKRVSAHATVALARRAQPRGHLAIVGLGPGDPRHRTPAATDALRAAAVVIGYGPYLALAADVITGAQEIVESPIGDEFVRAKQALADAEAGRRVALVCSGDAGVFALASPVFELALAQEPLDCDLEVIPGVTAATSAAALLGAPLGHDHALISLSDLLTPWAVIERRLDAAARADLVIALYNPRSRGRPDHLARALAVIGRHRAPATPVGVVTDASRPGQRVTVTTLAGTDPAAVGMTSLVIVGASQTRADDRHVVTPRGYAP
jgi:cobalt-precorrin 5A hydrolase/precorrin-3B C17-methyltransferase